MSKKKQKQGQDQLEQVIQHQIAETIIIEGQLLNSINQVTANIKLYLQVKIPIILEYVKELTLGQIIKLNDNLTFTLCGKKQNIQIIDVLPPSDENAWIIDSRSKFKYNYSQDNNRTTDQSLNQSVVLLYQDDILEQINQIFLQFQKYQYLIDIKLPQVKGILITGQTGCGKSQVMKYIKSHYTNYKCAYIQISQFDNTIKELIQVIDRSIMENQIILIDDLLGMDEDNQNKFKLYLIKLFEQILDKEILIIASLISVKDLSDQLRRSGRFEKEINIELPNHDQRAKILELEFSRTHLTISKDILNDISYQMSGFTINDIRCLVREFLFLISGVETIVPQQIFKVALSKLNPSGLRDIIADVPKVDWDQIGGYEDIKQEIRKVVEWPLKYPQQLKNLGITPSKGILLYGPPGCSKTLLARALCTQCNLSFIAVKGPEIFSKYVGDSEKTVREIFRKARICAPSVIFFDEIDAIAPQRQGSTDVSDRVLIQLLTEIDGFESLKNVIIIAATNRPASIDKALLRPGRFDHLIFVDLPDLEAREAIFKVNLQHMKISQDIKINDFINKTEGYTGAEICQICREAGLNAMSRDLQAEYIEEQDFIKAFKKVNPSVSQMDRLVFLQFAKQIL